MKNDELKSTATTTGLSSNNIKKPEWISELSKSLTQSALDFRFFSPSTKDQLAALTEQSIGNTTINQDIFSSNGTLTDIVKRIDNNTQSVRALIGDIDTSTISSVGNLMNDIVHPNTAAQNISSALNETLIPAISKNQMSLDINGIASTLGDVTSVIDKSWLDVEPAWTIKTDDLLKVDTESIASPAIKRLLSMEQETSKLLGNDSMITSIATQVDTINSVYAGIDDRWRDVVIPKALVEDLQDLAVNQHSEIQKTGIASKWRLGILEASSLFADRQISWNNNLISELQDQTEEDDEINEVRDKGTSALSLIPQYIAYTSRKDSKTTPEEGLELSPITENTEKGKKIIDNVVRINEICERTRKKQIFKYTGKMVRASATIGGMFCSNNDEFGKMIDDLYFIFYENIEHIKNLVSEETVKTEDVYQCIFRVKDIRTDIRHDFEHGNRTKIKNKQKDIADAYEHYTGKKALIHQKDFVRLQRGLYDEFIKLEEHLMEVLCLDNKDNENQQCDC